MFRRPTAARCRRGTRNGVIKRGSRSTKGDGMSRAFLVCCAAMALSLGARAATFDVKTFGAKADGKTLDRDAINKAIDAAAAAGGGTGDLPPGTHVTGFLSLSRH